MDIKFSFLYLSVVSLCVSTASAIYCFQCNSGFHAGCDSLSTNDTDSPYYKECTTVHEGYSSFCRRSYYKIIGDDTTARIDRECGWLVHKDNTTRCYEADTEYKYEVHCQCFTDGCNAATSQFSHPKVFILATLTLILGTRILLNRF